jgi:cytochrome oxidase assembly protein ShyY1
VGLNKKSREPYAYAKSALALVLILGCFWASQWQYHRGSDRHDRNFEITSQTALPLIQLESALVNLDENEWRRVSVTGTFNNERQILLRNRYFEGKYGFEVLTAFTSTSGRLFWVDRGWVQAGASAVEEPEIVPAPNGEVEIIGRIRFDRSLPQGNFFALPSDGTGLISEANARSSNEIIGIDSPFYLDLLSGSMPELTPQVPAELPELSDGPHLAYAVQWIIFAGLIMYGRFLIRREVLTREEISVET